MRSVDWHLASWCITLLLHVKRTCTKDPAFRAPRTNDYDAGSPRGVGAHPPARYCCCRHAFGHGRTGDAGQEPDRTNNAEKQADKSDKADMKT